MGAYQSINILQRDSKYGWKRDIGDHRDKWHKFNHQFNAQNSVDLRDKCTPVFNQGKLGSCTANAIVGAFEFDSLRQKCFDKPFSRLFVYYNERFIEHTTETDSGASLRDGIKTITQVGICSQDLWTYDINMFTTRPYDECYLDANKHKCLIYKRLEQDLDQFKKCLSCGLPFVFGFSVYSSFEKIGSDGIMTMPGRKEKMLGGHAVLCVGYDDDEQMFIVRNSWGSEWGEGGYFYMPYKFIIDPIYASDFWMIERVTSTSKQVVKHVEKPTIDIDYVSSDDGEISP